MRNRIYRYTNHPLNEWSMVGAWRKAQQIITRSKDKLGGMGMGSAYHTSYNITLFFLSSTHTHTHSFSLLYLPQTDTLFSYLALLPLPSFLIHLRRRMPFVPATFSGFPPIFLAALLVTSPDNFGLFSFSFIFSIDR